MFVVYWLGGNPDIDGTARFRLFDANALADALRFTEDLRRRQADGEDIGFITLCSENPHSVGKPGAADPPAGYDWKKRRR
ncbi:hypothetical protein AWB77_01403 [Caballeronia fortuita]|uniref:Uncharacterized protein n=1 Tax=Caballeronia fortuita TaxID=1777138 RepID=A0A158A3N6_9BURK|nr:hypothetical protein [Caballeronia fortuita]SAK52408.1 hypothetical protein AWB77_01403 [Caballeronia fortuita]